MNTAPSGPHDPYVDIAQRLRAVQVQMQQRGLPAVVLTPGADLRYLTGYEANLSERLTALVLRDGAEPLLIVPVLEAPLARQCAAAEQGMHIQTWDETDEPGRMISAAIGHTNKIAVADRMWAQHLFAIHEATGARLSSAADLMGALRIEKSAAEIASLRSAAAAIDAVHSQMGTWLRVGRTEREVAKDVAAAIIDSGHEAVSFTIIGSGPNGASPHHGYSERIVGAGDVVVVDLGGVMPDGYGSDCTRTYVVGAGPSAEVSGIYEVLYAAQQAATESVRPGISAQDVDRAAREVIASAGYGEQFIHRTGHGIGLEGHEGPYLVEGNSLLLTEGMAFSIEPGIYFDGNFGMRLEDIVVCTASGADPLNTVDRALIELAG